MPARSGNTAACAKTVAAAARRARRRQSKAFAVWFAAIAISFVVLVAGLTGAHSATTGFTTAPSPAPATTTAGTVTLRPIHVAQDAMQCLVAPSTEDGFVTITIANTSSQVIDKRRIVYYEMGISTNEPLHGVRAPAVIAVGEQFSALVPAQSDLMAGICRAWVYMPLESLIPAATPFH